MLSYQHIYHAGCLADVHKHASLATVLNVMAQKDKPIYYMETHAGRGLYNLASVESQKTNEANYGIKALQNKFPQDHPFTKVLNTVQQKYGKNFYPGSPTIAHEILRREDRLFLMELHPQEFTALKSNMINYRNVFLRNNDGYSEVLKSSPPIVRRGMVLIDPSFEVKSEYLAAAKFIKSLHKKWPETVIMLWYPILRNGLHKDMTGELKGLPKFYQQEMGFKAAKESNTIGSGIIICNLPYGCEASLSAIKPLFK